MSPAPELYACLRAPEFPAQALLRLRPQASDQSCVVMEGEPPLEQVCSLNRKARALGIERGMTQVEVDTFPSVAIFKRSLAEEAAARAALIECASCFSPRVEDRSAGVELLLVIDIAGTGKLFGPPESLAANLLSRVCALGIVASIAVSSNFHTAVALAKGLSMHEQIRVVPVGEEAQALAPLRLMILDLTPVQAETFSLWGIGTLGMLAALPEVELIARMGQAGKRLHQLARGERTHLFTPLEPDFSLEERIDLDSPVEALDALLFVANLMLEQLIMRAAARVFALASVRVTLSLECGATHTRTVRPALPSTDRQLWLKLRHLDLEAHPPSAPILAVVLTAEPGSTSKVQLGLFSPQLPEPARLDVTLARICAIVGEENAGRPQLLDSHAPGAFRIVPFTVPSVRPSELPSAPVRPALRRLRPPEAVFVTLENARPAALVFRQRRYAIERAYGPWQADGEWWSPTLWGCEQWDLVLRAHDGATLCCCLVRDLFRNEWQMAALYD